jgi:raffinose/stachyose/melibiose transport system permease protein
MRVSAWTPLLFLFPALFFYTLVIVYPSIFTLFLSFFEWNGIAAKVFVGLNNYRSVLMDDPIFRIAVKNNLIWSVSMLVIPTIIGLMLAMLLNRKLSGRVLFRGVFYFPHILSLIVVSLMWIWIYHPTMGVLNDLFGKLGWTDLQKNWLGDDKIALFSVIVPGAWQMTGQSMVLFLAGLQSIPAEPYESAKVDGANRWQSFWYVTRPMLGETTVVVMATTLISSMKVFDIIFAMTFGGPGRSTQVLGTWMYFQSFSYNNIGLGSTISVLLVLFVSVIIIPYVIYTSKRSL